MSEPVKSQISDRKIMAQTKIEEIGGKRHFSMTLPSGREVKAVFSSGGVIKWCAAVNAEIEADEQEERARQKKLWQERKAAPTAEPGLTMTFPSLPAATAAGTSSSTPAAPGSLSDPLAFLDAALRQAETEELHWRGAALSATANWEKAKADLLKWRAIAESLHKAPPLPDSNYLKIPAGTTLTTDEDD